MLGKCRQGVDRNTQGENEAIPLSASALFSLVRVASETKHKTAQLPPYLLFVACIASTNTLTDKSDAEEFSALSRRF